MRLRLVFGVTAGLAALARLATAAPILAFEERAVAVSGCTPHAQVVWFSVAKQIEGYMARFVRREDVLLDNDGDGVLRFELGRAVPLQSIWVAVDLATGEAAVGAPEGYPLRDASREPGQGRGKPGQPGWSESGRELLELLVVRPGQGAWSLTLGDGGEEDDDRSADGRLTAALARMRPVGMSPSPPELFQPGDVVVAVDPDRMEVLAERIPSQQQP